MKKFWFRFSAFLLALTAIASSFSVPLILNSSLPSKQTGSDMTAPNLTVILDAGHGGEDGGAVSESGLLEKDVNLSIAMRLRELLESNGITVVMTRSTDTLLYDRTVDYQGRKKALDLAARRKIAEETEQCIFVSIHMNAFPQERYSGLQVWYSPNHTASFTLAETVQSMTQSKLQPENDRQIKAANSSIYLLHHLTVPAILVECGFLSNPEEAEKLSSDIYRQKLAFLLFLALTEGMEKISSDFASGS